MNNIRFDSRVCQYLPDWYKDIAEYKQICQAESSQMEAAEALTRRVYGNFYFDTMDATALSEWESLFDIIASSDDTVEFRRARLINRLSMRPPFTIGFLKKQLDQLIGAGNYNLIVDPGNYTLYVESSAESQAYAIEVAYLVGHIKPAHIVYLNTPLITEGLLMNETVAKGVIQYNYRLGGWGLGLEPFSSASDLEVFKLATTKSITNAMLGDMSTAAKDLIASAKINGSITISNLTKAVSGNVLTITYSVLSTQTNAITSIDLCDSNGNALTSATVYIPIPSETSIKHTFVIQEGVNGN